MSDALESENSDPLIAKIVALAESGDLNLASKICVDILGSMKETQPLLENHGPIFTSDNVQTSSVAAEVPFILGLASLQSGDLDRAERCFTWVVRALPNQVDAPLMLTKVIRARNDDFRTHDVLKWFLDHFPDNADEQTALGEIYFRFARYKDALTHFRHALELRPEDHHLSARIEFAARATLMDFDPRTRIQSASRQPRLAVFISDNNRWREAKLARGLREIGWNVVLLFRHPLRYAPEKYFDACYKYVTPDDALTAARSWNADIYHMFTQLNYETAELILRDKPGPVIVDPYDIFEDAFEDSFYASLPHMVKQRDMEGPVLTPTDGVCSRDLMYQAAKHRHNIGAPSLFFPEFCWNDLEVDPANKLHHRDGELHVVFGSSIVLKTDEGDYTFESYLWLAKILNENAIHFHIYPMIHPSEQEQLTRELLQLQDKMPYFHFHEPVFGDAWLTELSQYDVGVCFSFADEVGMPKKITTDAGMRVGLGGKVADYLDAGLVTLSNPGGMNGWLTKRCGFGECVDWQGVNDAAFWRSFSTRVLNGEFDLETARNKWSIAAHSQRLADFYEAVICADVAAPRGDRAI